MNYTNTINTLRQKRLDRQNLGAGRFFNDSSIGNNQITTNQAPNFNIDNVQDQSNNYYNTGLGQLIKGQQENISAGRLARQEMKNKIEQGNKTDNQFNALQKIQNMKADKLENSINNQLGSMSNIENPILESGKQYIGTKYQWGGNSLTKGIDCSGLTQQLFSQQGKEIPRTSSEQAKGGIPISYENMQPGDLVFYDMKGKGNVTHVGIYAGNGQMLHSGTAGVEFEDISKPFWKNKYVTTKRY